MTQREMKTMLADAVAEGVKAGLALKAAPAVDAAIPAPSATVNGKYVVPTPAAKAAKDPWQKDLRLNKTVVGTHADGTQIVIGFDPKYGFGISGNKGAASSYITFHKYETWKELAELATFASKAIAEHWAVEPEVPAAK